MSVGLDFVNISLAAYGTSLGLGSVFGTGSCNDYFFISMCHLRNAAVSGYTAYGTSMSLSTGCNTGRLGYGRPIAPGVAESGKLYLNALVTYCTSVSCFTNSVALRLSNDSCIFNIALSVNGRNVHGDNAGLGSTANRTGLGNATLGGTGCLNNSLFPVVIDYGDLFDLNSLTYAAGVALFTGELTGRSKGDRTLVVYVLTYGILIGTDHSGAVSMIYLKAGVTHNLVTRSNVGTNETFTDLCTAVSAVGSLGLGPGTPEVVAHRSYDLFDILITNYAVTNEYAVAAAGGLNAVIAFVLIVVNYGLGLKTGCANALAFAMLGRGSFLGDFPVAPYMVTGSGNHYVFLVGGADCATKLDLTCFEAGGSLDDIILGIELIGVYGLGDGDILGSPAERAGLHHCSFIGAGGILGFAVFHFPFPFAKVVLAAFGINVTVEVDRLFAANLVKSECRAALVNAVCISSNGEVVNLIKGLAVCEACANVVLAVELVCENGSLFILDELIASFNGDGLGCIDAFA